MSGPLPAVLAPLTVPASMLYGAIIRRRNARYDRGRGVQRVGTPVVAVGNLTVGGTGKTPTVTWLARQLLDRGLRPAIAMRGYRARAGAPSDEQAEYALHLPDVPVVADPDRVAASRRLLAGHSGIDCVLLDDGFQHRRLHRDLDLVLVDATRPGLDDRMLPAGHLREPVSGLRRASAVIVTRADGVDDDLAARIERAHGRPPLAWSRHAWTGLQRFESRDAAHPEPVAWLAGRIVGTMLGVGHPGSIVAQLRAAGAEIAVRIPAADHQHYGPAMLRRAAERTRGLDALVVTAKDWVKIRDLIDFDDWPTPVLVPVLELDVFRGAEALVERVVATAGADGAGRDGPAGAAERAAAHG